jgi:hypothetical protein
MSVSYNGLINGNIGPVDLVVLLQKHYGGSNYAIQIENPLEGHRPVGQNVDHFTITFEENLSEEAKARQPWDRKGLIKHRMMHLFINGNCKGDYAEVTSENMTFVSLGRNGECEEIIKPLVMLLGGYIKDESKSHDWVRPY